MHAYYHPNTWALLGLGESVSCHLFAEGRSYNGGLLFLQNISATISMYYQYPTIENSKNEDTNDC